MTQQIQPVSPASSLVIVSPDKKGDTDIDIDAHEQDLLDKSVTRDFEGIGPEIAGIRLRTLSLSRTMRLHEVKNEIMAGKKVKDMSNPIYAAMEFLYIMDLSNDPKKIVKQVFGDRDEWREAVNEWGEEIPACDTVVSEVIEFINDSTSTRVKAKPPESLKQALSESEGNG